MRKKCATPIKPTGLDEILILVSTVYKRKKSTIRYLLCTFIYFLYVMHRDLVTQVLFVIPNLEQERKMEYQPFTSGCVGVNNTSNKSHPETVPFLRQKATLSHV